MLSGGILGKRYVLDRAKVGIGREVDNGVSLTHSTVSRHHANICQEGDGFQVEDLNSRNGTFVNGEKVDGVAPIGVGDTLKIGGAVLKLVQGGNTEARFHEEIYKRTILDELTDLANRRHMSEFLEREIARSRRHHRPLSLALIDIDHFKQVNDTLGHEAGDVVLRGVADTLRHNVRRDELAARYGGEEFVVVLPETDCDGAVRFAERVSSAIREKDFVTDRGQVNLTISVGVTEYQRGQKADELLRSADSRLYSAKEAGRDQIVSDDR